MSKRIFGIWGICTVLSFRLIVVVIGAILFSMALIGRIDDRPVQASQEPKTLAAVPVEHVIPMTARLPSTTRALPATPLTLMPTPLPLLLTSTIAFPTPVSAEVTLVLATAVVGDSRVNVRSGPGTDYTRVGFFEPGEQAQIIGRHSDWWQIVYNGAPAWVASWVVTAVNAVDVPEVELPSIPPSTETAPSPALILPLAVSEEIAEERWIDVDLTQQLLTMYEGNTPVYTTLVSTGLPQTPTPEGQFRIWVKFRYDDMEGPGYYLADVPYVMYFYEGYGLHGAFWHANFGHPMSHGCVNLPITEAEWLFNWANVGTLVNVHS